MNSDTLAGLGLGTLVGSLLGFSSQSIVASTIGAIIAIFASFAGVSNPKLFFSSEDQNRGIRIAVFGFAATASFLGCYWILANHILNPSVKKLKDELTSSGFTVDRAEILIGGKYYGSLPSEWKPTGSGQ